MGNGRGVSRGDRSRSARLERLRRAVRGAQRADPVFAARYQYLISREQNKLTPAQAQTVIAAAILRQLHATITTGQARDPVTATRGTGHHSQRSPPEQPLRHKLTAGVSPPRH